MILFHNESAHLRRWPRKQWFFCEQPSPVGGATPIVDCRAMYRALPARLAETFERKGLSYVRTFTRASMWTGVISTRPTSVPWSRRPAASRAWRSNGWPMAACKPVPLVRQ